MPPRRNCQKVRCEKESDWQVGFVFRSDPGILPVWEKVIPSTIGLCHRHRHDFTALDLIDDPHIEFAKQAFPPDAPPVLEATEIKLFPIGDPHLN